MSNSLLLTCPVACFWSTHVWAQAAPAAPLAGPPQASSDVSTPAEQAGPVASTPPLRFQLENGLRVVLAPRSDRRRVAVAIAYHVGERDDPPGYRGLAHLTEHVMFEGMASHSGSSFDEWLARAGATGMNGITDRDYTTYFQELPSAEVKLGLWLEASRMAYLLSWVDATVIERARAAVLHELDERTWPVSYAEGYELAALYPEGHPYHRPLEEPDDIEAIELPHVQWFFQEAYVPSNATLAVVGDFDPRAARDYIETVFGAIRGGAPAIARAEPPPVELRGRHELSVRWRLLQQACSYTWPVPSGASAQDDRALDVLASHLEHTLDQAALEQDELRVAHAQYGESELSGEFRLAWVMDEHAKQEAIQKQVDALLERARRELLSPAELARARDPLRRASELGRENLTVKARLLARSMPDESEGEQPGEFRAGYADVTAEQVRAAAQRWLPADRLVAMCAQYRDGAPAAPRVRRHFKPSTGAAR
jgi:zinc protease